jgi:integrase
MISWEEEPRDLAALVVRLVGSVIETGDPWQPYRLLDSTGVAVDPVAVYLRDLQAIGRPASTQRSYALALLRWFRFLWTVGIGWDQATRVEARDFCCWMQVTAKPVRTHWRHRDTQPSPQGLPTSAAERSAIPNPVTGKSAPGRKYAPTTSVHSETVLRSFYDFHRDASSGPMVNPFPLVRGRLGGRAHAHHNPLEPYRNERSGLYRPKVATRVLRRIPDERFNEIFAGLCSHRDRALIALYVSTGARASELLGATCGDADAGQQLVTVIRKGTRALQPLPASPDAFVWLRLYQAQIQELVPTGRDQPLWWTLRRPFRPLTYHAARQMFNRANAVLGSNWTLHDLRHTAAGWPATPTCH